MSCRHSADDFPLKTILNDLWMTSSSSDTTTIRGKVLFNLVRSLNFRNWRLSTNGQLLLSVVITWNNSNVPQTLLQLRCTFWCAISIITMRIWIAYYPPPCYRNVFVLDLMIPLFDRSFSCINFQDTTHIFILQQELEKNPCRFPCYGNWYMTTL